MAPGFEGPSRSFMQFLAKAAADELSSRLADIDRIRLRDMDAAGIDVAVLSQTAPSVQGERDAAAALASAQRNNDYLAQRIAAHPDRFAGFATVPMHNPRIAADELERAVVELGFKGALVNGHTQGVYYDAPVYDVFWDRVQALDVPFYLHPISMSSIPEALEGHPELQGATWGWGFETGSHALRLLFSGVFDRFPALKVILGHMGEGLPFLRWRFDSRFAAYPFGVKLERKPSEYIGTNIVVTTSGVCSHPSLLGAIGELGAEAVMFSVDYPYESVASAADFIDSAPLDALTLNLVRHDNAERILKLKQAQPTVATA